MHLVVATMYSDMYLVDIVMRGIKGLGDGSHVLEVSCKAPPAQLRGGRSAFVGEGYVVAAVGNG